MWVKITCSCRLCLLFNNKKIYLQSCTSAKSYQYVGNHLQKATTFSCSPATTGRELQPPSSCISIYVFQYVDANLQKATTLFLPSGTFFHKFLYWIHQHHSIIKYICINQSPFHQTKPDSNNHFSKCCNQKTAAVTNQ